MKLAQSLSFGTWFVESFARPQIGAASGSTLLEPAPDNETAAGEFVALLLTETLPVTLPADSGANVTVKIAVSPGARARPTGSPPAPKPGPETMTFEMVTSESPELVNRTVCMAMSPTLTLPKLKLNALVVSSGSFTVRLAVPETPLCVAVIVCGPPGFTPVANPNEVIVADVLSDDAHVAEFVRFCVLLSLYIPVAVNCRLLPTATIAGFGVTAIDTSVAGVTVSSVEPVMFPLVAEIADVPVPTVVARPVMPIVATPGVAEAHVTLASTCVELSLNVPVAVNCCESPLAVDGFVGLTLIDCSTAAVTVSTAVFEVIPLWVALMSLEPMATPVARPVALIVAAAVLEEVQVTELVRFWVVPSLKVPVAVNCCESPLAIEALAGAMVIDCSTAAVTVSSVEPLMLPLVAEIVDVPVPTVVAKPVALIVATVAVPDAHTALLSTCAELSLNVPVAVNCCVAPLLIEGFAGVTAIDTSVAGVTVSSVEPLMLPLVALIVVLPTFKAAAKPVVLMVATVAVPEAHTALPSTCVELSLNVPVAVNCCVPPAATLGFAGVTAIDTSVAGVTVRSAALLVTVPAVLLTTTSKLAPLSVAGVV